MYNNKKITMKFKKDNQAFTLIEMIIGLAIASMVILSVYTFMSVGTKSYEESSRIADLQQEMQLANNFIADAVMEGITENTTFYDDGVVKKLDTGNKVLFYNKNMKKFAIYEKDEEAGEDLEDHLITNRMTSFEVSFLNTEPEISTSDDGPGGGDAFPTDDITYASSNMIKITTSFNIKNKNIKSEKIYMIRN